MTRMKYPLFLSMVLLTAASPPQENWSRPALRDAAPFIDKANDEWTRAIVTGDADVMCAPYDSKGIFIGPDGTVVSGKDAVCAMYARKRPPDVKVLKATIASDGRVAHDPDDVYEWGTARMTVQRGRAVKRSSGRYLTVWHREQDKWLIIRNIAF